MSDLILSNGGCDSGCCRDVRVQGCASGVPHLMVTAYSDTAANTFWINQATGAISTTMPSGFVTGDCTAVSGNDYEYQIMCDAGNANQSYIQIIGFNTQTGVPTVTNTAMDGVTAYVPVTPSRCSDRETFDVTGTTEYCDAGVSLFGTAIFNVTTNPPTLVATIYRNAAGTVVTPSGAIQMGRCAAGAVALRSGGVSIASGTFAATLGPDGTSWTPPTGLKSVTVGARRSNTTNATTSAANRVQINFTSGGRVVLLTNEIRSWSSEDMNTQGDINNVTSFGNAAALINFNYL